MNEQPDSSPSHRPASEDAIDQLEISRLKLQRERKLSTCAALQTKLEAINAKTLFCDSEEALKQLTRFAKLVQKKQVCYQNYCCCLSRLLID